jgi:hypothetical protein
MHWVGCARTLLMVFLLVYSRTAPALPWSEGPGFRTIEVKPGPSGKAGFTLMNPKATGVWFTNELQGDFYFTNSVAHNGAGLAIGDVDRDGWADIYLCSSHGTNRLYRNLGDWRFEEMDSGEAACAGQLSTGATFADVDGDGDLDLLVNGIPEGTRLFLNDGKGRWTEVKDSGLSRTNAAMSMALADIDGDGALDLYCTHYIDVMYNKKTIYEIKLPVASLGLTAPLTGGTQFGLGMAINDGDGALVDGVQYGQAGQQGQKGWGGLGAHSIVFGKTASETARVTLGTNVLGGDRMFLSAIDPAILTFSFRATDKGLSIVTNASAKLIIDGQAVTLTASPK